MEALWQDLRYGSRQLARNPGFTATAVVTLALGIGVSTAIFSVVDTVLLRPLPYTEPDRLVMVYEGEQGRAVIAWTEFNTYVHQARHLESVSALQPITATIIGRDQPEQVSGALVSASLFPMLGVHPILGRNFLPEEDRPGAGQVVLLSEGLWRRSYGADPSIVGKPVMLEVNESWGRQVERPQSFTVVGVLPGSLQALVSRIEGDVWLPLAPEPYDSHDLIVIGRMKPGVTPSQVKSDLEAITAPLRASLHGDEREVRVQVIPLLEDLLGNWKRALVVLLGAAGLVLLIACVNLSSLFLARGCGRQREMAVRAALGAGRRRLIGQLLTESLLIALLGGVLAVLIAQWSLEILASLGSEVVARLDAVRLDARVFSFQAGMVILAAVVSGVMPALRLSSSAVYPGLKESGRGLGEGRGSRRLRRLTVAVEVALAVVLLIGSGLMTRTLARLWSVDPGFDARNVLTLRLALPRRAYQSEAELGAFYEPLFERIRALPGVEAVGINHALPFGGLSTGTLVSKHETGERVQAQWRLVSPQYFSTLRVPLLRGRVFEPADMGGRLQTAVIDQLLAKQLWVDQDPIGQRLVLIDDPPATVVGVVGAIRDSGLDQGSAPTVYLPFFPRVGALTVRSTSDPSALVPSIRRILADLDRTVAPSDIHLMAERVARSFALQRCTTFLLGVFATTALVIGLVGLYGAISFSIGQQTREFGIRLALGAQRVDILKLVLAEGVGIVLAGIMAGLAASLGLTRLLADLLFEVSAADPATFAAVPLAMLVVTLLACYFPARRAMRVDPMVALRYE
ncbi:MAG: ABC transporter permease [Acidobacteria bacterium]|nr:ABC transporter permease [Acidobacteriota bacterium]